MTTPNYIANLIKRFASGISREHSYRGDLETLIRTLVTTVEITNEPANVTDCGNPDYVITRAKIPVGYIEAKDVGKDLNSKSYKEQFNRYKNALDNLIITDYIWFQFFQNGILVHEIKIGEVENGIIKPIPENYAQFENLLQDFCTHISQTIKSSKKLAEMMAGKARLLQNILENAITSDEISRENTSLKGQYDTFKQILIHDLKPKGFADIYAQTLAYGMFAARLHDKTLDNFSRQEAAELIPKSNPFLRKLFGYVAGPDIDERIVTVVDNLAEVFRATDIDGLLHNFGKSTQMNDPIIHFYETFLAAYDAKLRKARGVWYTPEPVVNFIVRAVDEVLKTDFNLPQGLADTTKTTIKVKTDIPSKKFKSGYKEVDKEVHKVQILDPATGTGTFLAEVVKFIYNKNFKSMQGAWSGYVEEHLIPRLNGFELLMASYAMAHLKLDMLLTETGYKSKKNNRLNIYLTNSLEAETGTVPNLFMSQWLTEEALMADVVKRNTPVMCIIGNPPYSGESANKGDWIMDLMQDYKKEPGGKEKLKEQNSKFINDDYVKFLRYGQHYIEKNGSGVLAFINPHGFLDNPTFRGMRWNLLKTYDKIYTIDLHGNSKKKEVSPDGSVDQNVFDIMQGVAITIFVKTDKKNKNELGDVFHYDLYGKRDLKYDFLWKSSLKAINFEKLPNKAPSYFMVQKDFELEVSYNKGFSITDLFMINSLGIQTHRDALCIDSSKILLEERIKDFFNQDIEDDSIKLKYSLKENKEWKLSNQRNGKFDSEHIIKIDYRPFDSQYIYFDRKIVDRLRNNVSKHIVNKDNYCLIVPRQCVSDWRYSFISKNIIESNLTGTAGRFGSGNFFPLYLYPDKNEEGIFSEDKRKPNLNDTIIKEIANKIGLRFISERETTLNLSLYLEGYPKEFSPIDLLDYIYAVLHSPAYREKYKEFLKIDFPRVPYPKDKKTFWNLVKSGTEIRQIHLLESDQTENYITTYPKEGNNVITTKIAKKDWEVFDTENQLGRIWINETQYFDYIPVVVWEFYIGGYQPAQKWLKDRKERALKFEDILHYQKIIVALSETDKIMQQINLIEIE
ncbi:DNA methyltransferase [Polaribacter litorisediminis]|uniref:type ISP restriction/modification enzyme n=1 Tax=Polaribacter litorisediminis TaxID=1908341 RepID=UPI001CBE2E99|nr:type ISP restriction/modification enzyme [Polaribacter litorisediminis]UAM96845.1 DNA methyltransferase [Polaribacter litorisediminis]